jgi:parallel beta-helix repeat protein
MRKTLTIGIVMILVTMVFATVLMNTTAVFSGNITIKPDGSVDPTGAPINQVGTIYTLTDDISGSIIIQKSGITLDGAGHTIQGTGSGVGLSLASISGVTIEDLNIKGFLQGIYLVDSSGNTVSGNMVSDNKYGIYLSYSSSNTICGNTVSDNSYYGIVLSGDSILGNTDDNTIRENMLLANQVGIYLMEYSKNNIISGNTASGLGYPGSPSFPTFGIRLSGSDSNTIRGNTVSYSNYGIWLEQSEINTISVNTASGNARGIYLKEQSNGNTISGNAISGYTVSDEFGIRLWESSSNTIKENMVSGNTWGIYLHEFCSNNVIYHNNLIDNIIHGYDSDPASNDWHHPGLLEGNYWSDYTGLDDGSGVGKHAIAGDGIGDTLIPYPMTDYDFYPLMKPWIQDLKTFIENLIEYIENMGLDYGIENSLVSKLKNALKSLENGQYNTAMNQLSAFINEVEALRGKKLTGEEANVLIAEVSAIIDKIANP